MRECNQITDAGLMQLTKLTDLNMDACHRITNAGLAQLVRLTKLEMKECHQITYSGVARMKHLAEFANADGKLIKEYVPLLCAVKFNNAPGVARLLASGVDVNALMGPYSTPLFMEAAQYCDESVQTLQMFIDAGAHVNARDCIMLGVSQWDVNIVRLLLTAGAWVDAATEDGDTALCDTCNTFPSVSRATHAFISMVTLLLAAGAAF
jgi:hypothetical protein